MDRINPADIVLPEVDEQYPADVTPEPVDPTSYVMLNDTVLVKRVDDEFRSEVERNAASVTSIQSNKGLVVNIDLESTIIRVAIGDKVLFSEHAANDVTLDGIKYLLLDPRQIYLKL